MRRHLIALIAPTLGACAATVSETRDLFGERALLIECGAEVQRCLDKANEACPRGYDVMQSGENRTAFETGTQGSRQSTVFTEHVMMVKCR